MDACCFKCSKAGPNTTPAAPFSAVPAPRDTGGAGKGRGLTAAAPHPKITARIDREPASKPVMGNWTASCSSVAAAAYSSGR